nr:drug resistance MFS transporter, drug:H+ antiporter-2 (14 Spanner) (DHA2) family [Klebsiella pneumoniae]
MAFVIRALQDRTFSLGCYFSFMAGVGIFATIYLTPLYLGSVRGFSALEIGPAVFSTGLFRSCLFRFIRGSPTASTCAGC